MAVLTTTLGAEFTPAAGYFVVRVSGGMATLLRKNSAGDARFEPVMGSPISGGVDVYNAIAGPVYKLQSATADVNVTVSADQ
jgi:hypothetical protein